MGDGGKKDKTKVHISKERLSSAAEGGKENDMSKEPDGAE